MGWSLGEDRNCKRFVGYGVVAFCDYPGCTKTIDRGLYYVCGGEPYGGDEGCGLFFCDEHMHYGQFSGQKCIRCADNKTPFKPKKYEHPRWIKHVLTHGSWQQWREENPEEVRRYKKMMKTIKYMQQHKQLIVKEEYLYDQVSE